MTFLTCGERALGQAAAAAELALQAALLAVGQDVEADVDAGDALDAARRRWRRRSGSGS